MNFFKTINSVNEVEANTTNQNDLVLNNSYLDIENMYNDSNCIISNTIITSKSDALNFSKNNIDNCSTVENSVKNQLRRITFSTKLHPQESWILILP